MTHKIQIDAAPLVVGSRYPQPYMQLRNGHFVHRDGRPYAQPRPANQEAATPSPAPGTAASARR